MRAATATNVLCVRLVWAYVRRALVVATLCRGRSWAKATRHAALALAVALASSSLPCQQAQAQYVVTRTEIGPDVVRAHVVAELAPVIAVVRREATHAATLAAPGLFAPRDFGTHRLRELALEVNDVHFGRGAHGSQVRVEVDADVTALREARRLVWEGVVPTVRLVSEGRHRVARARLVVAVDVAVAAQSVAVRILGERLRLSEPIAADLDLGRRTLHRHVEPIPDDPALAGLRPEAAAVEGIDGSRLRFVVRFRRV